MAFFDSPKAAAVFKHAVLNQYLPPFVMKTGSKSVGGRVAFVDGYAGPGLYSDGTNGSPALAIDVARNIANNRVLECHFVEKDRDCYTDLTRLVDDRATDLPVQTYYGDVTDHFDELIESTSRVPTLMFLDPYGLVVSFEAVSRIFDRPSGLGQPAVEALINFTAMGLRRIAGLLADCDRNRKALQHMDEVCGGDWWRATWTENQHDKAAAEKAVVRGYAERLGRAGRCGWWISEVRNKSHHVPVYYLVFLSRHRDGLTEFGDALSRALAKWRRVVHNEDAKGTLFEDSFDDAEAALEEGWTSEIEQNLRRLLADGQHFTIYDRYAEVFGTAVGQAREKHLRKAWKLLYEAGITQTDSKGKLAFKRIQPA